MDINSGQGRGDLPDKSANSRSHCRCVGGNANFKGTAGRIAPGIEKREIAAAWGLFTQAVVFSVGRNADDHKVEGAAQVNPNPPPNGVRLAEIIASHRLVDQS